MYCSNHCAKTLHKDLEKIKRNNCEVSFMDIQVDWQASCSYKC